MKISLIALIFLTLLFKAKAQEVNPFESIGKKGKMLTLSNGKYKEIHADDSLQQIGSVIVNMNTGKIHGFVEIDTVYSEATLDPTVISRWYALDPEAKKYTSLSPYGFVANNPILYVEIDGAVFDLGNLSATQKEQYEAGIKQLSASKLFRYYYEVLQNSQTVYIIKEDSQNDKGGNFNPNNSTVTLKSLESLSIMSQELFHAFQSELKVYDPTDDHSVIETEGDLMTEYVANEASLLIGRMLLEQGEAGGWAEDILKTNGDRFTNPTNEQVQSPEYVNDFQNAVDKRIEHFKTKGEKYKGYTTPNSCTMPKAIQEVFNKMNEIEKAKVKEPEQKVNDGQK